jgi:hypothetical protein
MPDLTKQHLIELAESKLEDAKRLLAAGGSGNAYYLAGYAVELMLKAILSTKIRAETLPGPELMRDLFTHDFRRLVRLAELADALKSRSDADPVFFAKWEIVLQWSEGSRYDVRGSEAAKELVDAIEDPNHGVLQWLKRQLSPVA